ncbi:unnamed protein product [Effrenium voratum]|uniref:Asparagine synthetase domain-containing protein n=1 Tax=Effrenium voratum TaxID=2562239 RepID=A0AA36I7A3_9DINO|nr:unnamed protein product [Effrenium voratum]CAJ1452342.1 unnamed protein product [Effrenium voratum]
MSRNSQRRQHTGPAAWPQLHSFSIGLRGSRELSARLAVSHFLGTVHHEYVFTVEEALDALPDVIYHLETFDVTTIRASTPMYLMARRIRATGVKMVLSGEGADEIFGGYLYFHKAPNAEEFHAENVRKARVVLRKRNRWGPAPMERPSHGVVVSCGRFLFLFLLLTFKHPKGPQGGETHMLMSSCPDALIATYCQAVKNPSGLKLLARCNAPRSAPSHWLLLAVLTPK